MKKLQFWCSCKKYNIVLKYNTDIFANFFIFRKKYSLYVSLTQNSVELLFGGTKRVT